MFIIHSLCLVRHSNLFALAASGMSRPVKTCFIQKERKKNRHTDVTITYVIAVVVFLYWPRYITSMLDSVHLASIRRKLALSQEQMARLLAVSFASVNRWEGGHSSPTGPARDVYLAIDAALRAGRSSASILQAANNERGLFLYALFRMAYSQARRSR